MNRFHLAFLFSIAFLTSNALKAKPEQAVQTATEATNLLPFAIDQYVISGATSFYFGLSIAGAQQFSLAQFVIKPYEGRVLEAKAPEKITLDYESDQTNPFFNKRITHLSLLANHPVVVTDAEPNALYYTLNFAAENQPMQVLSAKGIKAANGAVGIINSLSLIQTTSNERYIVAAVKPHEGQWGDEGSGLALIKADSFEVPAPNTKDVKEAKNEKKKKKSKKNEDEKPKTQKRFTLNILDAQTGQVSGNKALALDIAAQNNPLNINDGLGAIEPGIVDMYWDDLFGRLYVPVHVRTKDNAHADQGACALLVGRVEEDKLCLEPIVPAQALDSSIDHVVAAKGSHKSVSIHKVRIMHTSTGLSYLIVVGGCGNKDETSSLVHAFPLVNKAGDQTSNELAKDKEHGLIAKRNVKPQIDFLRGRYGRLRGRKIKETPKFPDEFYSQHERTVTVGADGQLPNSIDEVIVGRDTVHVLVKKDGNGQCAGVFSSQAIFNQDGIIVAWSPWQRTKCIDEKVKGIFIGDQHRFALSFIEQDNKGMIEIRDTDWVQEQKKTQERTLAQCLQNELPADIGGIQGLYDFNKSVPGLSSDDQAVSLLIATGNKKVVLAQTGATDQEGLFRSVNEFDCVALTDGTLKQRQPATMLSLSGGVLNELGPISCATIASIDDESWLVVGGVNGVAVLATQDGAGWQTKNGLQYGFGGLRSEMSFKKIGNYRFVKKVVQDGDNLYILAHDRLERICLTRKLNKETPTLLATAQEFKAQFTDVIVSGPFALLGSAGGLFRVGVGGNMIQATKSDDLNWTSIALPVGSPYVVSLYTVNSFGKESGFAHDGQVYVLTGAPSSYDSHLFRLFVQDTDDYGITDETVALVNDYAYRDQVGSFIVFGGCRNNFATDGLIHLSTCSGNRSVLHVLPAFIGGKIIPSSRGYQVPIDWTKKRQIGPIVKNSATGDWLVAGDYGLCTYK